MTPLYQKGVCFYIAIATCIMSLDTSAQEIPLPQLSQGGRKMTQKFPSGIFTGRPGMAFYDPSKSGVNPKDEVSMDQLGEVLASMEGDTNIRELAVQYIVSCELISSDPIEEKHLRQEEKRHRSELFKRVDLLMREEFDNISASFYGLIIHEFLHNVEQGLGE